MFSCGDHTCSPSWSHLATNTVLEDALFTSTIYESFTTRKLRGRACGRAECLRKGKTYWSHEHKHFMPVDTALLWLLFIPSWHPSNSKGEHLFSRGNLMETPGNTASLLTSSYKSFPKGMSFGLSLAKDKTLFFPNVNPEEHHTGTFFSVVGIM